MKRFKKVYLEITNICNMHCSFCHGTKRKKEYMDREHFEIALEKLKPYTDYIYFHLLGEPFCHPDIKEYISLADKKGFKVSITTNGTLLDLSIADFPLYKVSVSLHSFEKDSKEEQTAYLERVCAFAKKASENSILVSLRLWNKGAEGIQNNITEEYLKFAFKDWKEGRSGSFTLDKGIFLEYANRFEWPDINIVEKSDKKFCYGLRDQIGILVDGRVVPCCLDAEGDITLGNIFTSSLDEILLTERVSSILKGFDERRAVEDLCKKCKYATRF